MDQWRNWLPEAGITTSALFALWRLMGRTPLRSLIRLKNRLFDLGALLIRLQTCEADGRAKDETIASQNKMIATWRERALSSGYPDGSTAADTGTSSPPPNEPPPTPK
jgi:hypothetical protein